MIRLTSPISDGACRPYALGQASTGVSAPSSTLAPMGFRGLTVSLLVRSCQSAWAHPSVEWLVCCQAAALEAVCHPLCQTNHSQDPNPYRHVCRQKSHSDQSRAGRSFDCCRRPHGARPAPISSGYSCRQPRLLPAIRMKAKFAAFLDVSRRCSFPGFLWSDLWPSPFCAARRGPAGSPAPSIFEDLG